MNTIELIKKYERKLHLKAYFNDVIEWNKIAGKLNDEKAKENQHLLIEEEYHELVVAKTPEEYCDALIDLFVVCGMKYYHQFESYPDYRVDIEGVIEGIDGIGKSIVTGDHWKSFLYIEAILEKCTFDVVGCLNAVSQSNWTKFPSFVDFGEDEVYCGAECERIEKEGRYKGIYYTLVEVDEETLVVFKDEKGKVVKPFSWVEADLSEFI